MGGDLKRVWKFRKIWRKMARKGVCDSWGSVECRRVWREWRMLGYPEPLPQFIWNTVSALRDDE